MAQINNFIDNVDLSESTSLTHLLDRHDRDNDINETNVIKHSPYYSETQFIDLLCQKAGLCILDLNDNDNDNEISLFGHKFIQHY